MNQSDKIQLQEAKNTLLKTISLVYGTEAQFIQKNNKFGLEDLLMLIDAVQLNTKYLLFDLEATRRERTMLTKIIKDANND